MPTKRAMPAHPIRAAWCLERREASYACVVVVYVFMCGVKGGAEFERGVLVSVYIIALTQHI